MQLLRIALIIFHHDVKINYEKEVQEPCTANNVVNCSF